VLRALYLVDGIVAPKGSHHLDGHMHPKTVPIELSSPFPYQAGAMFTAVLAYPDNRIRRERLFRAICRYEVIKRASEDRDYRTNPQLIPPEIFSDPDPRFWGDLKNGTEQMKRRSIATLSVLIPYLGPWVVGGGTLRLKELSEMAAQILGWSPKSSSNFIDKVWVHTRPVAHIMIPYVAWVVFEATPQNVSLKLCPETHFVAQMIKASEELRLKIPTIKSDSAPLIREEEMIRLLPVILE
jgi:hypothetical protein